MILFHGQNNQVYDATKTWPIVSYCCSWQHLS